MSDLGFIKHAGTRRAAERVLSSMRSGHVMFWHHGQGRSFAVIDRREVSPRVMACLIEGGVIKPRGDALLPDDSQTFVIVRPSDG